AGLGEHALVASGSIPHVVERAFAGHVYDVRGHAGVGGHVGETTGGFSLGDLRLAEVVVERCHLPFAAVFLHQEVDHIAVGRMHGDDAAVRLHLVHQAHHLAVVDHQ